MRRIGQFLPAFAALAVVAVILAGAIAATRARIRERMRTASVIRWAVPAIPNLGKWPPAFADRVRAATDSARRLDDPEKELEELARLYHANDRYPEAQLAERGLAALEPERPLWTWLLADACQNLGDEDSAATYLEKTVALDPNYAPAQLKLAELYLKRDDLAKARRWYDRLLRLVPGDPYARLGLARIEMAEGKPSDARRELEAIVRAHPDFYSAHNLLAELSDLAGDHAEAARERDAVEGRFRESADPWLMQVYAWSFDPFHRADAGLPAGAPPSPP